MKVLLIDPPFYSLQGLKTNKASLGLALIAAVVKRKGVDVSVYAPDLEVAHEAPRDEEVINKIDISRFVFQRYKEKGAVHLFKDMKKALYGLL